MANKDQDRKGDERAGAFPPTSERVVGAPHTKIEQILNDLARSVAPGERVESLRRGLAGLTSRLPAESGQGSWDFVRISAHLIVSVTRAAYAERTWIDVPADETFKVRILMRGRLTDASGETIVQGPGAFVEAFPGESVSGYHVEPGEIGLIVLHCRMPQLTDVLKLPPASVPPPLDCLLDHGRSSQPRGDQIRLGPNVLRAANDIMGASLHYSDELLRAYVEAKSNEILCSVVRQLQQPPSEALSDLTLTVRDINRIYEARDILRDNYVDPPSISELARAVAINQTKLKAAFKAVFGETIFGFIRQSRMEKAIELLLDTDRTISEIAYAVGYEYPANFTHAFKRYHGYLPSDVQRPTTQLPEERPKAR